LLKSNSLKQFIQARSLTRQMHLESKKRRSFVALLFAAGDLRCYTQKEVTMGLLRTFVGFSSTDIKKGLRKGLRVKP
jgi:hypothetical protein